MEEPRPGYDLLVTAYMFWQAKQEVQPAAGKTDVYAPALDVPHPLDQSRSLVSSIVTNYVYRTVVCAGWLGLVLRCMTFAYRPDSSNCGIYTTPSRINLSHRRMYIWDPLWFASHTSERGKTCISDWISLSTCPASARASCLMGCVRTTSWQGSSSPGADSCMAQQ